MEFLATSFRRRVESLLRIDPESKPRVYMQVYDSSKIGNLNYALELIFSAGIATLGLVLNSPAVVIGAMLISPLMGPILSAGLAFAAADLYLGFKALWAILVSSLAAIALSAGLVWLLPFQSSTPEILARIQPNLLDLGVALFSGLAGSVVVCRGGGGGGVTALPGVAIAVALMPPLCTVGFGVGSGFSWSIIDGAGLLFLTNLAAIVTSAFLVFYVVRMDAPDVRMRIDYGILERASPDRLYRLLAHTRLARGLGDIGQLRWRVLMLLVVLAILFVPLRQSLLHLRDETVARAAASEAVRSLVPPEAIVTQQLDLGPERVNIRLVVTSAVPPEKIRAAERSVLRRTGKEATLVVRRVTSEEELAALRERLRAPAPPPFEDLDSIKAELMARLERPLKEVWPADAAPLLSYELGFTPEGVLVRARYKSEKPLDPTTEEMLSKILQARLKADRFRLVLEHEPPPPPPKPPRSRRR
ncbi:MAG: DUF389 domain-containing protein [Acidobacteriota bacterium]